MGKYDLWTSEKNEPNLMKLVYRNMIASSNYGQRVKYGRGNLTKLKSTIFKNNIEEN